MQIGDQPFPRPNDSVPLSQFYGFAPLSILQSPVININLSLCEINDILSGYQPINGQYTYYRDDKLSVFLRKHLNEWIDGKSSTPDSKLPKMSTPPKCGGPSPTYTGTGDMSPSTEFQVW